MATKNFIIIFAFILYHTMRNYLFFLLLFGMISIGASQEKADDTTTGKSPFLSIRPKKKKKDSLSLTAKNYKMISLWQDTVSVDTSLTLKKYFKHNLLGKDTFGRMPFSNVGQPFNTLIYHSENTNQTALLGATAKDYLYTPVKDVLYYSVPTPLTELRYKNGIEQGDMLDALFTVNFLPELNVFIGYKGMTSLGNYQNMATESGNFKAGASFHSSDKRYSGVVHYTSSTLSQQENGGISNPEQFESGNSQYLNRAVLDVAFTNASSKKISERYFLQHQYRFFQIGSSSSNEGLTLKHQLYTEKQLYSFQQTVSNTYFGAAYVPESISDRVSLKTIHNELGAELSLPYLGKSYIFGKVQHYRYKFNNLFYKQGVLQPHQIVSTDYLLGATWNRTLGGFSVEANIQKMLLGKMSRNFAQGEISYRFSSQTRATVGASLQTSMPTFMQMLYQSDYKSYQWNHTDDFNPIFSKNVFANISTPWGAISADISHINNYTYFKSESNDKQNIVSVHQQNEAISHAKIDIHQAYSLWKFTLDNRITFQHVIQNTPILNVPTYVGRHTLYFSTYLFDKAMFLQTGLCVNYFSSYYANEYNPLLSEFITQTQTKIGAFPVMDYFVNAKVKTMRIFISAEHFNASFTGYNYYSAPKYPYRDLTIRFGIVWNFFS